MSDLPWYLQRRDVTPRPRPARVAVPGTASRYARAAFQGELDRLTNAVEGERNHQLNIAAFCLSQLVSSGHLDRDEVWGSLYSTALAIGLEHGETVATLHSAFGAGEQQPRDVPELEEDEPPPVTVLQLLRGGADSAEDAQEPQEDAQEDRAAFIRSRFPALDWQALWDSEEEEEWIVEPLLPARRLVALYSPPKTGKSLLMLELAVGIARGTEVLGVVPDRPRRVLYVDFENDPRGDVRTRLQAMGYKPEDLENLVYLSYPQLAHLDTFTGGAELLAVVQEYGCEVVVIDTVSRAVGGEENDNDTWLGFYRNTGLTLKAAGVATVRLDHTGKDQSKGMRGGSAKYGDVDAVWSLTSPGEELLHLECTANRLPIPEKEVVLRRRTDPWLHHVVEVERRQIVEATQVQELVNVLDGLVGRDTELTVNEAQRRLREVGKGKRRTLISRAVDARNLRFNSANTTTALAGGEDL